MDYLVVMEIPEPLQDLLGVEDDGGLVVFQGTPLGPQERRQAPYRPRGRTSLCYHRGD